MHEGLILVPMVPRVAVNARFILSHMHAVPRKPSFVKNESDN